MLLKFYLKAWLAPHCKVCAMSPGWHKQTQHVSPDFIVNAQQAEVVRKIFHFHEPISMLAWY